jgi:hypothetical protein
VNDLTPLIPDENTTSGAVFPLDLDSAVSPYRQYKNLSIRIERLPALARLSKGHNNGDHSWTVTLDELEGLLYLPPDGQEGLVTLTIKLISINDDSASMLEQFDLPVTPDMACTLPQPSDPAPDPITPAEMTVLEEEIAVLTAEVAELRERNIAADATHATAIAALQDRHSSALQEQATAAETRLAQTLAHHLEAARVSWEAQQSDRVETAVQNAVQKTEAELTSRLGQPNEDQISEILARRLNDARVSWEAEAQRRIDDAVRDAVQRTETDTRARLGQTNEDQVSEVLARRLNDARVSWEAEAQRRIDDAVRDAVQRTEADTRARIEQPNEARLAQALTLQLEKARAAWETESQQRVIAAVQDAEEKANADARLQLEQIEKVWREDSAREVEELTARSAQTEAALEATRLQMSEYERQSEESLHNLRDELALAQDLLHTRESELSDARQQVKRAEAEGSRRVIESELAMSRANWEAELRVHLDTAAAQAAANLEERNRAWQAEKEEILASTEENTQQRVRQALEQWQQETQDAMSKARQEWEAAENARLANAKVHWNEVAHVAKGRTAVAGVAQRKRRLRIGGRTWRWALVAACLAGGFLIYSRFEPEIRQDLLPKIAAYKDEIKPTLQEAGAKLKSELSDVVNSGGKSPTINVEIANVRSGPSRNAPVAMTLRRNNAVTPLEIRGSWVRVQIDGRGGARGWLHKSLLKGPVVPINRSDPGR